MYLEIVLPNLTGGSSPLITGSSNARWVNSIAYALFDSIELQIHGSTIEKHTDLWLDLWNELTDEEFKEHTLVGKSSSIIGTTPDSTTYDNATKWYLPLHFFFTRKLSLSLPIFLLEDQQIKIKRLATKTIVSNPNDTLDSNTAYALLKSKITVITNYSKNVLKPILITECANANSDLKDLLNKSKLTLSKQPSRISNKDTNALQVIFNKCNSLGTAYHLKNKLYDILHSRNLKHERFIKTINE